MREAGGLDLGLPSPVWNWISLLICLRQDRYAKYDGTDVTGHSLKLQELGGEGKGEELTSSPEPARAPCWPASSVGQRSGPKGILDTYSFSQVLDPVL